MLSVIATPIGNLEDITLRAIRILKECDVVACEDTRHTKILLNHYEIHKPLISFHSQSGFQKIETILEMLLAGKHVALVSDAGTPGISDPGYALIAEAIQKNIMIIPVPGASAFLTALQGSGLPINNFHYRGFIPHKKGRQTFLQQIAESEETEVFYESPYRVMKTLEELKNKCPEKQMVVGRELTKKFEEFFRGTVEQTYTHFSQKKIQGEFVIIVGQKIT